MRIGGGTRTFGAALDAQKGLSAGFDVLRWGLALLIFYGHCKWLAGSTSTAAVSEALAALPTLADRGWSGWRRPLQVALVPMFFALSGFLVTASALRVREVGHFLTLRALRIFPALTVEVFLSALVLGPLLTALAFSDYFANAAFFRYFGNILGVVAFDLPGVFTGNKVTNIVNASLWTLPGEFYCYLIAALVMGTGVMFDRSKFTGLFAAASVALVGLSLVTGFGLTTTFASTPLLVYSFFAGCLVYHWRHEIPKHPVLFLVAGGASYVLLLKPELMFLAPLPLAYVTVYLGLHHHPRLGGLRKLDYSYGIYLYGFPITQAVLAVAPSFHGHGNWLAVVAGLITLVFAAASWHAIEQPMLQLKSRLTPRRRSEAQSQRPAEAVAH